MTRVLLAFSMAFILLIAAGCPEMTDDKPTANAPIPPPPPPPPAVDDAQAANDDSVPIEEVDPQQFAKEQAAANELETMGFLVIREPPDKVVTSVNFMSNKRKIDQKIADLVSALFRTPTLNFADTELNDEQLKALQNNRKLTSLLLSGTQVGDKGLANLANASSLVSLHLKNTKVTDAGLPHLTKLSELAILDLSGTKVTDRGLAEIAKCQSLDWLLLSDTGITDEGVQVLANSPNLKRLTIFNTQVTEQGVASLKASKPNLAVDSGTLK